MGAGRDVTGTAGRDVIVTAEATSVDAGAGDDLICVTAPRKEPGVYIDVEVDAGPGNDVVDAAGANSTRLRAILGSGADEFLGGPSQDSVVGGEMAADGSAGTDVERDLIDGAGGEDGIRTATCAAPRSGRPARAADPPLRPGSHFVGRPGQRRTGLSWPP